MNRVNVFFRDKSLRRKFPEKVNLWNASVLDSLTTFSILVSIFFYMYCFLISKSLIILIVLFSFIIFFIIFKKISSNIVKKKLKNQQLQHLYFGVHL